MNQLPNVSPEPAIAGDVDQVAEMIRDLSAWLKRKGIHQWSDSFSREWIVSEVNRGELFVVRDGVTVIASLVLSSEADELYDGPVGPAMYLKRVAVLRERSGQRLGEALVAWAEGEAMRRGAISLRLVCDSKNDFLKTYHQKLGYRPVGKTFYAPWRMTFDKFEKNLKAPYEIL